MTPYLHHILQPKLILGALGTVGIFSLVFRENKLYRFFEHLFIGLATGYAVQLSWTDVLRPLWWDPMIHKGEWAQVLILPVVAMFYTVYSRRHAWMARLLFGTIFGFVAGTVFQAFAGEYVPQIAASFKPVLPGNGVSISQAINNVIFIAILICVSVYFFFAFEQKNKAIQRTAIAGRWLLMIAFGATFGATIMTREALLIDRVRYLLFDWLQLDRIFRL
jgi:hypothetical protein